MKQGRDIYEYKELMLSTSITSTISRNIEQHGDIYVSDELILRTYITSTISPKAV